jgi:glycine oxidase ThiO
VNSNCANLEQDSTCDSLKEMQKDVLVIGGGAIGLGIALELALRGQSVGVLNRSFAEAALHAAAGMLAPQAEGILPGTMLDLCLQSRALYPDWVSKLETLTDQDCGYWPCGILEPVYASEPDRCPPFVPPYAVHSQWCDRTALDARQSGLSEAVVGAWWHPDDGQINNQQMAGVLRQAALKVGVELQEGVAVEQFHRQHDRIIGVQTTQGTFHAQHYVLATGAWSKELLPIPVTPRKGQLLAISPSEPHQLLQHVLYGSDVYIVPRKDGQLVIGATSEEVGFTSNNTAGGIQSLLNEAIRLYPTLAKGRFERCWWGFRPATPDELPILGASPYENLSLATGHFRNGILLIPATAMAIADQVLSQKNDPILAAFRWNRFE